MIAGEFPNETTDSIRIRQLIRNSNLKDEIIEDLVLDNIRLKNKLRNIKRKIKKL